ncbi:hypothetical protein F5B18DRAFT_658592 [Nemania serpens]|nr:hypothetical protein F5B18DRAFT_658592 [Nemania serpens]
MKKYLNYQPLSATTDDERAGGSLSSSTFAAVGNGLEGGDDDRMIVSLSFLCFSICLFFLSVVFYSERSMSRITDKRCMYRMSAPSPALEAVEYEWTTFNDQFLEDEYSGYPSTSSEAAWAALWDFGAFRVPVNTLAGLNKSSANGDFRRVDEGGVGGLLEGAHQIHCLNLVRQFIYRDHWNYSQLPSFSGGEKTRRHHVDHCIMTLKTVLTCDSDVTPYVFRRSESDGETVSVGFPRKCRTYSNLVSWVKEHSVFSTVE